MEESPTIVKQVTETYSKQKIVKIRFIGGLGNQIFQYFAGLSAVNKNNGSLILDFRWIEEGYGHAHSDIRDYLGDVYSTDKGDINFLAERIKSRIAKLNFVNNKFMGIHDTRESGFVEIPNFKKSIELRANYQSIEYFNEIKNLLPENFWKPKISAHQPPQLSNFPGEFIAIHVRGGDYIANEIYEIQSKDYYLNSVNRLRTKFPALPLVVFTNDRDYADGLLRNEFTFQYFNDSNLRASETLRIMSEAKAIVISNSTFSYWAAVSSKSNCVIAPSKWFKDQEVKENLYESNWVII